ncbi:flagellar assembly protein FliH [Pseudobutyrivibrio sp. YE44]|uniref:FliH/SctL family protein n=1 Tax=Pseudobutyrivibrio sp. YE44 TaxID=1520802 RepID=UPI00087E9EB0|nr:FliH/SctL family protein [Pseudobutyrivibrio sp. YE44]SDB11380.1 flagellar assembly protein FliH [Pseudobutyrivibrio sp. YE44]
MSSLSSHNVVYGFLVAPNEATEDGETNELVIDSNDKARELILKQEKAYKARLLELERERRLEAMRESGEEIPEGMDPDEFLGLADTIMQQEEPEVIPSVDTQAIIDEANEEAARIIADANAQAEEILNAAQLNADAMKNLARQDGEKEGYNEGTQRAALELANARDNMQAEVDRIENEYMQKQIEMEREIVEMCLPVFERVFSAELSGKKDVIYHLLDHCIMKIERTGQMQIKVSDANAEFIKSKKDEIQGKVGAEVGLDVIADPLLNDSQCIIETDGGIFDCSIDTELDNLIREIKALS